MSLKDDVAYWLADFERQTREHRYWQDGKFADLRLLLEIGDPIDPPIDPPVDPPGNATDLGTYHYGDVFPQTAGQNVTYSVKLTGPFGATVGFVAVPGPGVDRMTPFHYSQDGGPWVETTVGSVVATFYVDGQRHTISVSNSPAYFFLLQPY